MNLKGLNYFGSFKLFEFCFVLARIFSLKSEIYSIIIYQELSVIIIKLYFSNEILQNIQKGNTEKFINY